MAQQGVQADGKSLAGRCKPSKEASLRAWQGLEDAGNHTVVTTYGTTISLDGALKRGYHRRPGGDENLWALRSLLRPCTYLLDVCQDKVVVWLRCTRAQVFAVIKSASDSGGTPTIELFSEGAPGGVPFERQAAASECSDACALGNVHVGHCARC